MPLPRRFICYHPQDKNHFIRELHSICDGAFLNVDGTWRIGGRVLNGPDCLYFLLGWDGKVHDYGAFASEARRELLPFLTRCEKLKSSVGY